MTTIKNLEVERTANEQINHHQLSSSVKSHLIHFNNVNATIIYFFTLWA